MKLVKKAKFYVSCMTVLCMRKRKLIGAWWFRKVKESEKDSNTHLSNFLGNDTRPYPMRINCGWEYFQDLLWDFVDSIRAAFMQVYFWLSDALEWIKLHWIWTLVIAIIVLSLLASCCVFPALLGLVSSLAGKAFQTVCCCGGNLKKIFRRKSYNYIPYQWLCQFYI